MRIAYTEHALQRCGERLTTKEDVEKILAEPQEHPVEVDQGRMLAFRRFPDGWYVTVIYKVHGEECRVITVIPMTLDKLGLKLKQYKRPHRKDGNGGARIRFQEPEKPRLLNMDGFVWMPEVEDALAQGKPFPLKAKES